MGRDELGEPASLLIAAESGEQIGTGHVMRCLAFGQAWKRAGGAVVFLLRDASAGLTARICNEGFSVSPVPDTEEFLGKIEKQRRQHECRIIVLDGYRFRAAEQRALRDAGAQVLLLDDHGHVEHYSARWVLNQNSYARPQMYPRRESDTQLLLGPAYALLREEFLPWICWKREITERPTKILVTMGGSDPGDASSKIIESLDGLARIQGNGAFEAVLVLGSMNAHGAAVRRAVEKCSIRVRTVQNARDMPGLMAWADIAVAAAGITALELCYMGLPSLLLIAAENQQRVAVSLEQIGAAVNAGTTRDFSQERFIGQVCSLLESQNRRETISKKAHELVDGMGSERVRAAVMGRELKLRLAVESDCRALFEWINDPVTRAASFHPAHISWEEHTAWFKQQRRDRQSVIFIGEDASGIAVGQLRFNFKGEKAVLSVSVAPGRRSEGWGGALITFGALSLARGYQVSRIAAFVKPENQASVRLFQKSGFRQIGVERIAGQTALHFVWDCKTGAYGG